MTKSSNETNKSKSSASASSSRAKYTRGRNSNNNSGGKRVNHNNTLSQQHHQHHHVNATSTTPHQQQQQQQPQRSSTTNNSNSSKECTNEFDTVLGEAHDLLGAAAESQALGRLKMANTYLLLLHVRLIGLGKRFDRAILSNPESFSNLSTSPSSINSNDSNPNIITTSASSSPKTTSEITSNETSTTPTKQGEEDDEAAIKLSQVLPQGINLDSTMVEHLARAAMELHNKRTGKNTDNTLLSRNTNHSTTADDKQQQPRAVAWSIDEHNKCIEASQKYGTNSFSDISKAVGTRSEMEVKAHLRNASSKEKVSEQLLDTNATADTSAATPTKKKSGGKAKKPPSKAVYTDAYHHFDAKLHLHGI